LLPESPRCFGRSFEIFDSLNESAFRYYTVPNTKLAVFSLTGQ
jgi:hypothetical protein